MVFLHHENVSIVMPVPSVFSVWKIQEYTLDLNLQASWGRIVAYVAVVLFLLKATPSAPLTLEVLYFISSKNRVKSIS